MTRLATAGLLLLLFLVPLAAQDTSQNSDYLRAGERLLQQGTSAYQRGDFQRASGIILESIDSLERARESVLADQSAGTPEATS